MLARYPHIDDLIGKKFKSAPLMKGVASTGGLRTLRVKSPVDGQDRLGSAASLTHFPFVVVATNTIEAALADWRAQTRFMVSAATMLFSDSAARHLCLDGCSAEPMKF